MSDLVSLETEPLGAKLAGEWQVFRVRLAVVYHVAAFCGLIGTVKAFQLLVEPIRLRVTEVYFHKFFLRNFVFRDFLRLRA